MISYGLIRKLRTPGKTLSHIHASAATLFPSQPPAVLAVAIVVVVVVVSLSTTGPRCIIRNERCDWTIL